MKEQNNREEEIFLQALEMAPGEKRTVWLKEACGGDLDLRRDIEELLGAHDKPAPLFRDTGLGVESLKVLETSGEQPGDRCQLVKEIGRGWKATVWLEELGEPVQWKVAGR